MPRLRRVLISALLAALAAPAAAQFSPYFGKNKVRYDTFHWRVYKSPHFEIYYYPELEPHLTRIASYAESSYQKVSSDLKHSIEFAIPLIVYKTHSEFEQTNLFPDFIDEGILAFAEPVRNRMVLPIDETSDRLQGLITHELTHIFEYDMIPRSLIQRGVPLWVDEGLADYERGTWDDLDLMMIRDAAVSDQIPPMSRANELGGGGRLVYNLGHAVFEFVESRWGKEGIRQFLYMFRKNIAAGGVNEIYNNSFRIKPDEFDKAFDRWMKERFKPYRDKQRPDEYGPDMGPNDERTSFASVYAMSPSPSGEVFAALSGNRSDGELDLILLSARDGSILKNLTAGYTLKYEDIELSSPDFIAGRAVSFSPRGDYVAFIARTGKRRSLLLASATTGDIARKIPLDLDEAQSPCLLPDGRRVLFSALKDGVGDIFLMDLETGKYQNLTQDSFGDKYPQISPDGNLVVYNRRVSGKEKIYTFPLANPARKTQLTFGVFDDIAPIFSDDGKRIFYSSSEDDDILNLRSLDLTTGVIKQYTDVLGGNLSPSPLRGKGNERVAFISYFKGKYQLHAIETHEAMKEVEQEVLVAESDILDFEPDVRHQVITENKRKKGMFEGLMFEGRPPLTVGVSSSGDFFGGTQAVLVDVLSDKVFVVTAQSLREFRGYNVTYMNMSRRLQYGLSGFDDTVFFYASPYSLDPGFSRQGAFATRRLTGGSVNAVYPFDKYRRLEVSGGLMHQNEKFENEEAELLARAQAAALGQPFFLNSGTLAPLSVRLIGETARFRSFGPLTGSAYALSADFAPGIGDMLQRMTLQGDVRIYRRLLGDTVFAARVRAFQASGDNPDIFYFGGNNELRGYPYLSFSGNRGFHANLEIRLPVIHAMATPLGLFGPVRGTLYGGIGGASFRGENYEFSSSDPGRSYVNNLLFGEPVSGFHLVDGRASFGFGIDANVFGMPMHFDWSKLTDLKVVSDHWKFDFWIGFDF
jgi:hypothetical protein